MAFTFANGDLQVVSGTTTVWLPIATPWLSIAACSSQIYGKRNAAGGTLIAFDPYFGQSIVPSAIPCLPTEVTSSWMNNNPATTSVLGPTFVCPGAYSAVSTISVNPSTQQTLCCPSQYTLTTAITGKGAAPSQCISHLTPGETLTFQTANGGGPWGVATTIVPASTAASVWPTAVYAMHVNGFNVISAATTSKTSENTLSVTTTPSSATSQNPFPGPETSTSNGSGSLSKPATAGISVGITLAVIAVGVGAWLLFRRTKTRKGDETKGQPGDQEYVANAFEQKSQSALEMEVPSQSHEMPDFNLIEVKRKNMVHEMASA